MKATLLNTKKTVTEVLTYEIDGTDLKLVQTKVNGRSKTQQLISEREISKKIGNEYYIAYVKDIKEYIKSLNTINPYHDDKHKKGLYEANILKLIKDKKFDIKNIVYQFSNGHMIFNYKMKPLTTVYNFDYIGGGLDNGNYHLKRLMAYLKEHPYIVNKDDIEILDIPYYNCEKGRTKYLKIKVLAPQDEFVKIWDIVKDTQDYPSTRVSDYICSHYSESTDYDFLGIKQFRKN